MTTDSLSIKHPLDQKAYELAIAFYVLATGGLFLFNPQSLNSPVYSNWHEFGALYWGVSLVCIAIFHFVALLLNGKNLKISQPIRLIAVFSHLGVSLQFAEMFYTSGAIWGSITYGLFVPSILLLIGRNVMRFYLQENENAHSL